MNKNFGLFILFILIALAVPGNGAVPVLTTNNSASHNQWITTTNGVSINFNASADQVINTWTWSVDGTDVSNNYGNYTRAWTTGGVKVVKVIATNTTNGGSSYTWLVTVRAVKASTTVTPINISSYTSLRAQFTASPDIIEIAKVTFTPYTNINIIGNFFYLIIWALIFVMMWINQGKITLPAVLGMIIGAAVLAMLPAQYQLVAQAMVAIGFFAVLYVFFRERR